MSVFETVQSALQSDWLRPRLVGQQIAVPTSCLYPSGSWVNVYVDGGSREAVVHDDLGAVWEARSAGIEVENPARHFRSVAKKYGLEVNKSGSLIASRVPVNELAPMIVLVANASQESARVLLDKYKVESVRNVREQLRKLVDREFRNRVHHDEKILGSSNKKHRFDHVISVGDNRRLVLDFASPDANSINSRVVAHYDVSHAQHSNLKQRIVYDESESWTAANISLLEVGAPVLAYSSVPEMLDRLAA